MGSEGYLLSQFMAPATNLREDDWGGDLERRMRFPLAVAAAVREAVGAERRGRLPDLRVPTWCRAGRRSRTWSRWQVGWPAGRPTH